MTQRFSRSSGPQAATGSARTLHVEILKSLKELVGHPQTKNRSLGGFQSPGLAGK